MSDVMVIADEEANAAMQSRYVEEARGSDRIIIAGSYWGGHEYDAAIPEDGSVIWIGTPAACDSDRCRACVAITRGVPVPCSYGHCGHGRRSR